MMRTEDYVRTRRGRRKGHSREEIKRSSENGSAISLIVIRKITVTDLKQGDTKWIALIYTALWCP